MSGVMNVKTIAELINWQKVDYDFEFHPIPVHTDINVLILSEGESLLPVSNYFNKYYFSIFLRLHYFK